MSDLLAEVKAALEEYQEAGLHPGWDKIHAVIDKHDAKLLDWLGALVKRCESLQRKLDEAPGIDLEGCDITVRDGEVLWANGNIFTLRGCVVKPKELYAQEVEAAFREGFMVAESRLSDLTNSGVLGDSEQDAAWLASEARRKVGT